MKIAFTHNLKLTNSEDEAEFDTVETVDAIAAALNASGHDVERIEVSGPASQPTFAITSTPSLPQDEILARVLFQRASGNLSAFQALELANAAATLSGSGDAFEGLRRSLGVDNLNISTGATGGGRCSARIERAKFVPRRPCLRRPRSATHLTRAGPN